MDGAAQCLLLLLLAEAVAFGPGGDEVWMTTTAWSNPGGNPNGNHAMMGRSAMPFAMGKCLPSTMPNVSVVSEKVVCQGNPLANGTAW